ncbi:unnamed protein product [Didymodactylos carnosus]|uniref:Protein CNPPD1 n=1 Tax=Didymodactylos carnosus TaxID=1234261 RepID=A0A8S2E525_9BILA|nr:unnamed protein product [Didymodactylos carnosus]CAF3847451.1 unnamed protein product [Didymodactylos carnosus]
MIWHEKDDEWRTSLYYDLIVDDLNLPKFESCVHSLQELLEDNSSFVNVNFAVSVCKSRNLPSCVFVLSLLYMKRLRALRSSKLNDINIKELCVIAMLLADKYLIDEGEDEQLFNSEWAQASGMTTGRINQIERLVLEAMACDKLLKLLLKTKSIAEILAITSLVIIGSALSLHMAIFTGSLAHRALMKSLNSDAIQNNAICSYNHVSNTADNTALLEPILNQTYINKPNLGLDNDDVTFKEKLFNEIMLFHSINDSSFDNNNHFHYKQQQQPNWIVFKSDRLNIKKRSMWLKRGQSSSTYSCTVCALLESKSCSQA